MEPPWLDPRRQVLLLQLLLLLSPIVGDVFARKPLWEAEWSVDPVAPLRELVATNATAGPDNGSVSRSPVNTTAVNNTASQNVSAASLLPALQSVNTSRVVPPRNATLPELGNATINSSGNTTTGKAATAGTLAGSPGNMNQTTPASTTPLAPGDRNTTMLSSGLVNTTRVHNLTAPPSSAGVANQTVSANATLTVLVGNLSSASTTLPLAGVANHTLAANATSTVLVGNNLTARTTSAPLPLAGVANHSLSANATSTVLVGNLTSASTTSAPFPLAAVANHTLAANGTSTVLVGNNLTLASTTSAPLPLATRTMMPTTTASGMVAVTKMSETTPAGTAWITSNISAKGNSTLRNDNVKTACVDVPGWTDSEGDPCRTYVANKWCTPKGNYGVGWEPDIPFESLSNQGHSAKTACCGCGGGTSRTGNNPATSQKGTGMWTVSDGPCSVDIQGCALSPNYPQKYGPDQECTIAVDANKASPISVISFQTEAEVDILIVNNKKYSGSQGPHGITPQGTVRWTSDDESAGWKLCPTDHGNIEGTVLSTSKAAPLIYTTVGQTALVVTRGPCSVDNNGCALSPNFPNMYGNNQECIVSVIGGVQPISAVSFFTEKNFDYLVIGGKTYSGTMGPLKVMTSDSISWTSDARTTSVGWKLCPEGRLGITSASQMNQNAVVISSDPKNPRGFPWVLSSLVVLGAVAFIMACWYRYYTKTHHSTRMDFSDMGRGTSYGRRYMNLDGL